MVTQGRQPTDQQIMPTLVGIASSVAQRVIRLRLLSLSLLHERSDLSDITRDELFLDIYDHCKEYTMTSVTRMHALYNATRYIINSGVAGDFVECGVWRGGSSMLVARTLLRLNERDRTLHLYDTYEGMPDPTEEDVDVTGTPAKILLNESSRRDKIWAQAGLDDVRANLMQTGYPNSKLQFVKGMVEQTIPDSIPNKIALLRLDTDWYESTYHEFVHLFPRLSRGGVLIIDDYGHWRGAKLAADRYIEETGAKLLLNRIDYTGRMAVKLD